MVNEGKKGTALSEFLTSRNHLKFLRTTEANQSVSDHFWTLCIKGLTIVAKLSILKVYRILEQPMTQLLLTLKK